MTFYFPYSGNKRSELKHFNFTKVLEGVKTVVEPFCGSCSFSIKCFDHNPKLKYHMNDIHPQLNTFLKLIKKKTVINRLLNTTTPTKRRNCSKKLKSGLKAGTVTCTTGTWYKRGVLTDWACIMPNTHQRER